jgi:hypothetical protein
VREIVRALDAREVEEDARLALAASSAEEVHQIAEMRLRGAGLLDHPDIGEWLSTMIERGITI